MYSGIVFQRWPVTPGETFFLLFDPTTRADVKHTTLMSGIYFAVYMLFRTFGPAYYYYYLMLYIYIYAPPQ